MPPSRRTFFLTLISLILIYCLYFRAPSTPSPCDGDICYLPGMPSITPVRTHTKTSLSGARIAEQSTTSAERHFHSNNETLRPTLAKSTPFNSPSSILPSSTYKEDENEYWPESKTEDDFDWNGEELIENKKEEKDDDINDDSNNDYTALDGTTEIVDENELNGADNDNEYHLDTEEETQLNNNATGKAETIDEQEAIPIKKINKENPLDDDIFDSLEDSDPEWYRPPVDESKYTTASEETKYFAYLPHSGFHNQRIELNNALLLAWYMNRTLIMPPAMLGHVWKHRPFDQLLGLHVARHETFKRRCEKVLEKRSINSPMEQESEPESDSEPEPESEMTPEERLCAVTNSYSYVYWDELFNFKNLKRKIKYVNREEFHIEWLNETLGISEKDIYFIKDENLYDHMYWDGTDPATYPDLSKSSPDLRETRARYINLVAIEDLRNRKERLIHVGSTFGTGKVHAERGLHKHMMYWIRSQFVFANEVLLQSVDMAVARLGGPNTYLSVHARVGDGGFAKEAPLVMAQLFKDFSAKYSPFKNIKTLTAQECIESIPRRGSNTGTRDPAKFPPIFIATDARDSRESEYFEPFYRGYPCVLTLNDIWNLTDAPVSKLVNPRDGVNLGKFMIPFVDGLVAAQSIDFTRAIWSTFSVYIRDIHAMFKQGKIWTMRSKNSSVIIT